MEIDILKLNWVTNTKQINVKLDKILIKIIIKLFRIVIDYKNVMNNSLKSAKLERYQQNMNESLTIFEFSVYLISRSISPS